MMRTLVLYLRLLRPLFLLGAALLYALGCGVARYLGVSLDWGIYLLGQAWVTLIQAGTHTLNEYFDAQADANNPNRTPFSGGSGVIGPGKLPRVSAFWVAVSCYAFAASVSVLIIRHANPSPETLLLLVLIFLGAFFYSAPPLRLVSSGYGELITSIIVASLVPALAYQLQAGSPNRVLAMVTFPLTLLHLAMMLTFELPDYVTDIKYEKQTLLVRLGWQKAMLLHNLLVLSGFLLIGLALLFGLPVSIGLPAMLGLPVGIFQIWMINLIAAGGKPNWTTLTLTGVSTFGLVAYLLTFSFWTR